MKDPLYYILKHLLNKSVPEGSAPGTENISECVVLEDVKNNTAGNNRCNLT